MHRTSGFVLVVALAGAVVVIAACGGGSKAEATTPPPAEEPTAETGAAEPAAPACPELPGDAEQAFAEARAFDESGGGGDEYAVLAKRMQLYWRAAAAGHLEGQAIAGQLVFGTMFATDAPQPEERGEYVDAISFIFTAALRGHEGVLGFSPDVPKIVASKQIPAELEEPFSDLDRAWLEEALANSLTWIACYGDAAQ